MEKGSTLPFATENSPKTTTLRKNYHLAYEDTVSSPVLPAIQSLAKHNRDSSLIAQISKNLGDTTESAIKLVPPDNMTEEYLKDSSKNDSNIEENKIEPTQSLLICNQDALSSEECSNPPTSSTPASPSNQILKPIRKSPQKPSDHSDNLPTPTPLDIILPSNDTISEDSSLLLPFQHDTLASTPVPRKLTSVNFNDTSLEENDTVLDSTYKTPSKEINIGSVVAGRYEILSKISEGGFGVVYRARQMGLDRLVALKRLISQRDDTANQRFLLEANIIKDLVHPNTIQLIDAGMDGNHLYIVMEYIEGISLKTLINQEKTLPPERAIHIAIQVLKSLHEAHERGIIHRDVKPSNILIRDIIGERDFVKLLDFGIAKAKFKNNTRITQDGTIIGTPQYLAPELLFGDEPSPASDTFAVGLILVEMLTGKTLLPKDTKSLVKIATSKKPIPLPDSLLQSELAPVIQCALNLNPKQRYRSAQDMISALKQVELRYAYCNEIHKAPTQIIAQIPRKTFHAPRIALAAAIFILANAVLIFCLLK